MNKLTSAIIKSGLIVGTLDILSAFIYVFIKTGQFVPFSILKFVASGVFGKEASSGGTAIIVSGLVFHYLIAFSFTFFFFWLFPKIKALLENKLLTGIMYGIFIWIIMNLIIVPLSSVPHRPFNIVNALINALILIVCIGIPLSFMASNFYRKRAQLMK